MATSAACTSIRQFVGTARSDAVTVGCVIPIFVASPFARLPSQRGALPGFSVEVATRSAAGTAGRCSGTPSPWGREGKRRQGPGGFSERPRTLLKRRVVRILYNHGRDASQPTSATPSRRTTPVREVGQPAGNAQSAIGASSPVPDWRDNRWMSSQMHQADEEQRSGRNQQGPAATLRPPGRQSDASPSRWGGKALSHSRC